MKNFSSLVLFAAALSIGSCTAQTSTEKGAKSGDATRLENRFCREVVNAHNPAVLDEILGDDFVSHHFPAPGMNKKAAFAEGMKALLAGFPDIRITQVEQHETGGKVYTYAFWEATHTGTFMGIPPTGKKVHVEYMDIWRINEGQIRENWVVMDIMGLMIQLGVVPPPGAGN